uniref:RING-type domain-containing protein n=1 Tax=Heterorhabditis bacteriophora TaxID=37862 RepID=A0A1I7XNY7_HETBA
MRDREIAIRLQEEVNRTREAEATMTSEEIGMHEAILAHGSPEIIVISERNSNSNRMSRFPLRLAGSRIRELNRDTGIFGGDMIVDEPSDLSNAVANISYSSDDSSGESIVDDEVRNVLFLDSMYIFWDNTHEDIDPANNTYGRDSFVVSDEEVSEDDESDESEDDFDSDDDSVLMIHSNHNSTPTSSVPLNTAGAHSDEDDDTVIRCVNRWYAAANHHHSLDINNGHPPNNHRQCPLCRHNWTGQVEVTSMFHLRD